MSGRGSTHSGVPARLPSGLYEPPPAVLASAPAGLVVNFQGEDDRSHVFRTGTLPLPGWHDAVAATFAARTGPAGTRRTLASAQGTWQVLGQLLRYLDGLDQPPATPGELTAIHLDAYLRHRVRRSGPWMWDQLTELRALLRVPPLADHLDARVLDYLSQRVRKIYEVPAGRLTGYSDGELARIVEAARADVAAIRDRIDAGERLLAAWTQERAAWSGHDAELGAALSEIATTGLVPRVTGLGIAERTARIALAQRLLITRADREALLVLMVAVTGRNSETLKELPAEHRILGDRAAVELRIIKRRRGQQAWHDTVTWEIGPPHRQLHTPGGLYLLLHRLMARGRAISRSSTVWSIWRNAFRDFGNVGEHIDPFGAQLAAGLNLKGWAADHGLTTDSPSGDTSSGGEPLTVRLPLIRTAVEVRRTRALGGHLPSAARSNSTTVLFANYLRGDATARAWAEEVIGEAVLDAEQAALAAHRSHLARTGHTGLRIEAGQDTADASQGAWTACTDPQSHPATGRACQTPSYLDCFHCGNCLITNAHLPAILALADEFAERRTLLGEHDWWLRYGPVWAAIHRDILPKFTPAQLDRAATAKPADALLELAEDPWEHP